MGKALAANRKLVARVVGLVVSFGCCIALACVMGNLFGYLPLLVLALSIALSYAYMKVLERSLGFEESSDFQDCYRGTRSDFTISLINRSILVFTRLEVHYFVSDLFGDMANEGVAVVALAPRERRDLNLDITFAHIGTYSVGLQKAVVHDFLGIFTTTIENARAYKVDVKPRLFDLDDLEVSNEFAQESKRTLSSVINDGMDYAGVREYVMGDPFKTIHWKLSSRTPDGSYYTRLMETYANPGVSVFIDTSAPRYDHETLMGLFDAVVEAALSVDHLCRDRGYGTEIVYIGKDAAEKRESDIVPAEYGALVRSLPAIEAGGYQSIVEMLGGEQHSMAAKGNMVVCSSNFTDALLSTLVEIKQSHRQPILFAAVPPYLEEKEKAYVLARLQRLSVNRIPYRLFASVDEIAQGEVGDYAA